MNIQPTNATTPNQYVKLPSFNPSVKQHTFSMNFIMDGTVPKNTMFLFFNSVNTPTGGIYAYIDYAKPNTLVIYYKTTTFSFDFTPNLWNGLKHNLILLFGTLNTQVYLDGVLIGTLSGNFNVNCVNNYINYNNWNGNSYYFIGKLGELRLYDYILTAAQIKSLKSI
jgi:hypothetical protein